MIHTANFDEILAISEALNSKIRLDIVKFLLNENMNINALAKKIYLTNSALTMHIKKLEEAGIIGVTHESGVRGTQKVCSVKKRKIFFELDESGTTVADNHMFEIPIGHYSDYEVAPTCGIVTETEIIGTLDDPRYFAFPEHLKAELIWLTDGFLEYKIPNSLRANERPVELQVSLEIASEAPGYSEHFPSDIYFAINQKPLGYWTSPGEFNNRRGLFTPQWWFPNLGQYGQMKLLSVNDKGSFIDGLRISDVTIRDLNIDYRSNISLRVSAPVNAANRGGLTLFGKNFGDYAQGIRFTIFYERIEAAASS
jgi:predicted transcriptional regulator